MRTNGEDMEGKTNVESLIPVLDVRDVDISVAFYCDVLGFALEDKVEWAGRTEWALLKTGSVQLMLCASQDDLDDEEHTISEGIFFLHLDDPEAVILQMKNRGLDRNPEHRSQLGSKDFYLRDPDGYILWFSHRPPVKSQAQNGNPAAAQPSQPNLRNGATGPNGNHNFGENGHSHDHSIAAISMHKATPSAAGSAKN